jgi:hypothetical protein
MTFINIFYVVKLDSVINEYSEAVSHQHCYDDSADTSNRLTTLPSDNE